MTDLKAPPRLRDTTAYGPALAELATRVPSPARLQAGASRLRARLATAGSATMGGAGLVKLVLLAMVAGGMRADAPMIATPATTAALAISEQARPTSAALEMAVVEATPMRTVPAPAPAATPVPAATLAPARAPAPAPADQPPATAPVAAASTLAAQLRRYDDARREASAGRYESAASGMQALLDEFPATPLGVEARLSRAEYLAALGRHREAVAAFEMLARDPRLAARRGELMHVIGDQWLAAGDCAKAVTSLTAALAAHQLSRRDAATAHAKIEHCKKNQSSPVPAGNTP